MCSFAFVPLSFAVTMPLKRTNSRKTSFRKSHALNFAVGVTSHRDCTRASAAVVSAKCWFFVFGSRREKVGSKRLRTSNIKYFKSPFRTDNYTKHHKMQHWEHWKECQRVGDVGKQDFFEEQKPLNNRLYRYFGSKQVEKINLINALMVYVIICEMLWDPDDT